MNVEEVLRAAHRPLTTEEIMYRINGKNKASAHKELNGLKNRGMLIRLEINATVAQMELRSPITLWRLIK